MDLLLSSYNLKNRNGKRIIGNDYIIRKRERLLHICLNSPGCRFRKSGSCAMCDYGEGKKISIKSIDKILPYIENEQENVDSILIGTLGSIFDEEEVFKECLNKLFAFLQKMKINTIILESHYTTINEEICKWLVSSLRGKDIVIEIGLESTNKMVQEKCLNKNINLELLKEKINLVHRYQFSITANVFLGAPFLNVNEQINDTEESIQWAILNNVDSVTIFPANIRKNTLLYYLYENGKYQPIQHWMILELLKRIPKNYLSRIFLSWFGDWIEVDDRNQQNNIPPTCCEKCEDKWKEFYHYFQISDTSIERNNIIMKYENILENKCQCKNKFDLSVKENSNSNKKSSIQIGRRWLSEKIK